MIETTSSYSGASALLEMAALEMVDLTKTDTDLYEYQEKIDAAISVKGGIDRKITINDAKNNRISNLYGLLSIFDSADENIIIYTTMLKKSLYSRDDVIGYMYDWLNENPSRKLTILLKEEPNIETDYFFNIYSLLENPDQLDVRISTEKEARTCNVNGVIADDRIYKIKEVDAITKEENIVLNYNDPKTVKALIPAYQVLISDKHSKPIKKKTSTLFSFSINRKKREVELSTGTEEVLTAVSSIEKTVNDLLQVA